MNFIRNIGAYCSFVTELKKTDLFKGDVEKCLREMLKSVFGLK